MTKLAIIADIHGNSDALRAVLADIALENVDDVLNLGDHFSGPLDARETAKILMSHDFPSIAGNHERALLTTAYENMGSSDQLAFEQLPPEAFPWMRAQKKTLYHNDEIFMCHGVPENDEDYFLERPLHDGTCVQKSPEEIAMLALPISAKVILCAHTHIPRIVHNGHQLILNPGSVGLPAYLSDRPISHRCETGSPDARYAVLEKQDGAWHARLKSVSYDPSRMIALALKHHRPEWACALKTGRVAKSLLHPIYDVFS